MAAALGSKAFGSEVVNVKAATRESSRAGGASASAPMSLALPAGGFRLAPLVAAPPTESVSALIALLVAYTAREPDPTEDFEALTVVERHGQKDEL